MSKATGVSFAALATTIVFSALGMQAARAADDKAAQRATAGTLAPAIELEPRALNILKGSSAKLAGAKTLSFKAVVSDESPSRLGPPLVYFTTSEVTLHRPDKLRVVSPGDGSRNEFYYDGKTMTAYSPEENLVATAAAPATIDSMFAALQRSSGTYFPFEDLVVSDPYKDVADGLRVAFYIGQSDSVGGVNTHVIAYANDHAFVQAWIGADDRLPRRLRAVFRKDPLMLRHEMNLSDWRLDVPVLPGDFTPPEKAKKALPIPFGSPHAPPGDDRAPAGAKQL